MSAKSKNMDLNTDVVLSDHENESMAEKGRLSGVVLGGGGSSVGEEKEASEVRVLESVDEAKEEKMEGFLTKEIVGEGKGSALEGQCCVGSVVLGSSEVGVEKVKEVSLGAEKERKAVEDSGAKLYETSCSASLEPEKEKEDLAEKKSTIEDLGIDEMSRLQSLEAEEENSAENKRSVAEDLSAKLDETGCSQSLKVEKDKEELAEKEKDGVDNLGAQQEEMSRLQSREAEKERNTVEDLGTKLDETSHSQSLGAKKDNEDLPEKEKDGVDYSGAKQEEVSRLQSLEADDNKKDLAEKERNAVEDFGAKLDETSRSQSLEAEDDKQDLAEKERNAVEDLGIKLDETSRSQSLEAENDKQDLAEKERSVVEDLGAKLDTTSHSQSLEADDDKQALAQKDKNVIEAKLDEKSCSKSLEANKEKEDLAEKERNTVEDSGAKLNGTSHSQNLEAKKDIAEKEGDAIEDSGTKPDVTSHSHSQRPCVSEVLEPKAVESTISAGESTVPAVEGEMKADHHDKSFPKKDSEVIGDCEAADSVGLRHGTLEVNLEAEPKGSGTSSDSIDIVIDLNSKKGMGKGKGKGKGASRNVKAKSVPSKPGFSFGDLIWGKVRSHPWWPGQVCDPSAASRKAKKYFKRDAYLIAYYGDNTFAWNEPSQMKPFLEHFSQLEKQSNTEDFHYAIDCVLEEVSRRVEFSLACPCLSEEAHSQIESQIIVNAGIREDSSRIVGGDSSLTAASFNPDRLIMYIKELAQTPNDNVDGKLEFAVAQSELLAFSRWKGYSCLPEFTVLGGILESDAETVLPGNEKQCDETTRELVSEKEKPDSQNSVKRKLDSEESANLSKKKKSLSDLMVDKRTKTPEGENGRGSKIGSKKRKGSDPVSVDLPVKETKVAATVVDNKPQPPPSKQSFRVGERISKIASQLNGLSPILKNSNGKCKSTQPQTNSKEGTLSEDSEPKKLVETESSSEDEMSSKGPVRENDLSSSDEDKQSLEDLFGGGKTAKKLSKSGRKSKRPGVGELPHRLGPTTKSYWSERIGKSIPEDQDETTETRPGMVSKKEKHSDPEHELDSKEKIPGENPETEVEKKRKKKPADDCSDGNSQDESILTALVMKFTNSDSVPSETNLNKIFSSYKSLDKSKTEVLKNNRAQVVFAKRSDAETAFSSSGKYGMFGPALVSYRLKHLSSPPNASQNPKKRSKKK